MVDETTSWSCTSGWQLCLRKYIQLNSKIAVVVSSLPDLDCSTDIIFVVDESGSITAQHFHTMKIFLIQLVRRLDIDSGNTRVGLVTFANKVGTVFNLTDHSTVASLQSAIWSLGYRGGSTNTAAALAYVRTTMLTSAAGDRINVPNTVVVVTDGQSDNFSATVVSRLWNLLHVNSYALKQTRLIIYLPERCTWERLQPSVRWSQYALVNVGFCLVHVKYHISYWCMATQQACRSQLFRYASCGWPQIVSGHLVHIFSCSVINSIMNGSFDITFCIIINNRIYTITCGWFT